MTRSTTLGLIQKAHPTIRGQVLVTLQRSPYPLTADEVASKIGKPYGSVRPRLTELKLDGLVERVEEDSGLSTFGKKAVLWRTK